jgi:acyl-[acyl-carrier-protein]-phospholipid O-acyltransferase / long-chain-fatty-acid--[acyl-carrier-protein] ligase
MDVTEESAEPVSRRSWIGFWSMVVQQTQNAFNDKAAQFILIPLGGWLYQQHSQVETIAAVLITLPYVLFAPLAGWLSDNLPKRRVLIGSAVAQLLILAGLAAAIASHQMHIAMAGFFVLATQAAFFSPAKLGIVKELVGSRNLGFASGIQQMTSMLAMLVGQIAAGVIFSQRLAANSTAELPGGNGWAAALGPVLLLTVLSAPAIFLAWLVPQTKGHVAKVPLTRQVCFRHFAQMKELWHCPLLRRTSFGISFFWAFAGFINLWAIETAKEVTHGGVNFGTESSKMMAAASLGMASGFGFASMLQKKRIELGWVPLSGAAMTLGTLILACLHPSGWLFLGMLAVTAFFAAGFLTPLNAFLQDRCPPEKRGEILAAVNLQDCFAGIMAVVVLALFGLGYHHFGEPVWLGLSAQLVFVALACAAVTVFSMRMLAAEMVRVVGLAVIRLIYRIRSTGTDAFPEKGGVLLLPNHITWADAFFLTAACPRPVRFIMEGAFMANPLVGAFCKLFNTLPISSENPREAIRTAAEALKAGEVVCIFPEGQLSRTGALQGLKRGYELIARQAGAPMIPVWSHGSWGSIFSFERNLFFIKAPIPLKQGITVAFGPPLDPKDAGLEALQHALQKTSARAIQAACEDATGAVNRLVDMGRASALQLSAINSLQRREPLLYLPSEAEWVDEQDALRAYCSLWGSRLTESDRFSAGYWIGGQATRDALVTQSPQESGGIFFDFSPEARKRLEIPGWEHCPCLMVRGVIVAMSQPHPRKPLPGSSIQIGHKPDSWGILLPGFFVEQARLHGPSCPAEGLELPEGFRVDEEGFVFTA